MMTEQKDNFPVCIEYSFMVKNNDNKRLKNNKISL